MVVFHAAYLYFMISLRRRPDLLISYSLIGAQVGGLVALGVHTELIVVAGQDGVEDHARQCGDGQTGQGDVGAAHGKGDAAGGGEAQTAHEDDGGDDEVAGLGAGHRMNIPGTQSGNWQWRLLPGELTPELAEKIRRMTVLYGRADRPEEQTEEPSEQSETAQEA